MSNPLNLAAVVVTFALILLSPFSQRGRVGLAYGVGGAQSPVECDKKQSSTQRSRFTLQEVRFSSHCTG